VAGLAKTALTEEDKRILKVVASELFEIRKLVDELAETLVKLSDKELLKAFNAGEDNLKESQVDSYKEKLEKQLFIAEKEFRT
jgi:uncharacterized protein YjgD (DUF1641 family)